MILVGTSKSQNIWNTASCLLHFLVNLQKMQQQRFRRSYSLPATTNFSQQQRFRTSRQRNMPPMLRQILMQGKFQILQDPLAAQQWQQWAQQFATHAYARPSARCNIIAKHLIASNNTMQANNYFPVSPPTSPKERIAHVQHLMKQVQGAPTVKRKMEQQPAVKQVEQVVATTNKVDQKQQFEKWKQEQIAVWQAKQQALEQQVQQLQQERQAWYNEHAAVVEHQQNQHVLTMHQQLASVQQEIDYLHRALVTKQVGNFEKMEQDLIKRKQQLEQQLVVQNYRIPEMILPRAKF